MNIKMIPSKVKQLFKTKFLDKSVSIRRGYLLAYLKKVNIKPKQCYLI